MMMKPKYVAAHTHGCDKNNQGVGRMGGGEGLGITQGGLHLVFLLQLWTVAFRNAATGEQKQTRSQIN